jgi:hypothetical protein
MYIVVFFSHDKNPGINIDYKHIIVPTKYLYLRNKM